MMCSTSKNLCRIRFWQLFYLMHYTVNKTGIEASPKKLNIINKFNANIANNISANKYTNFYLQPI